MPRKKKVRDPMMPLMAADWLSSGSIALMTADEERGYLRLLLHAWLSGSCSLPDDDDALASLSLLGDKWRGPSGEKLRRCFKQKRNSLGTVLVNIKQDNLWKDRRKFIESQREKGRKSGAARGCEWNRGSTGVQPGHEPKANLTSTSTSTLTSSSKSKRPIPDFLKEVRPEMLRDTGALLAFIDSAQATNRLPPSEYVRNSAVALAVRALREGKRNPTGLYVRMVADQSWPHANDADTHEARELIKAHERSTSKAGGTLAEAGIDLSKVGRSIA